MEIYDHKPVLLGEALEFWAKKPDGFYVDATLGLGGHSDALLSAHPGAHVLGLDVDPQALGIARERLKKHGDRARIVKESYMNVEAALSRTHFGKPDGILLDLGVSSLQLDAPERGFSFNKPGPLDMRMDPHLPENALDIIKNRPAEELEKILRVYGEERFAKPIAKALKASLKQGSLTGTVSCAQIISSIYAGFGKHHERIHPATRTFQALRIAVNRELDALAVFLKEAPPLLSQGGRIVCISFHSLEDRMVKASFRELSRSCICPNDFPKCVCGGSSRYRVLTKKPVRPGDSEADENPRSRSAKMRALEKI